MKALREIINHPLAIDMGLAFASFFDNSCSCFGHTVHMLQKMDLHDDYQDEGIREEVSPAEAYPRW